MAMERRRSIILVAFIVNYLIGGALKAAKSFKIGKQVVWEAYQQVKRNGGSSGIDGQSISNFEINLKDNL
jgi:hypothetical protein